MWMWDLDEVRADERGAALVSTRRSRVTESLAFCAAANGLIRDWVPGACPWEGRFVDRPDLGEDDV